MIPTDLSPEFWHGFITGALTGVGVNLLRALMVSNRDESSALAGTGVGIAVGILLVILLVL